MTMARPDLDDELLTLLGGLSLPTALDAGRLAQLRAYPAAPFDDRGATRREFVVPARDGSPLTLTVFTPPAVEPGAPCVYWIHGGGMVMGDRFAQIDIPLDWLEQLGAVVVTVEYRLAPEVHGVTLVEDCFDGLLWTAAHAAQLGIDPARLVIAGTSAGGGLAAGVALMIRDGGGPDLAAQVLIGPMLDHRNRTKSARQYVTGPATWTRPMNEFGWHAVLGDLVDGADVPIHVSPALAEDLSGLPTTYLDVGSAEVFRDEDIAYAYRIWAAGGQAELHVWSGGCHGFDALFPQARLSVTARRTRTAWLGRVFGAVVPNC